MPAPPLDASPLRPSARGDRCCGRGYFCGCGVLVVFGHPLRAALRLHASPSHSEGEGNGVLCFFLGSRVRGNDGWLARMPEVGWGWRRVKSPGRFLTRSFGVNDLGFAPPPNFGGGFVDRVYELVCYQQSNTGALLARVIAPGCGPGWKRMPDHRPESSARVVKYQHSQHDPHRW